jgi:hypothetical protein
MAKKLVLILTLIIFLSGSLFAQKPDKHEAGKILLGINTGVGITPSLFNTGDYKEGLYGVGFNAGLNFDYYLFNWLSIGSGLSFYMDHIMELNETLSKDNFDSRWNAFEPPVFLAVPISVHINIPKVEWLYLGAGINLNIPLKLSIGNYSHGKFYLSVPIDFGFDSLFRGRVGPRFFFRITPEFHDYGTPILYGLVVQLWNWKIR